VSAGGLRQMSNPVIDTIGGNYTTESMSNADEIEDLRAALLGAFHDWRIPRAFADEAAQIDEPKAGDLAARIRDNWWMDIGPEILAYTALQCVMSDRLFSYCLPAYLLVGMGTGNCDLDLEIVNRIAPPWPQGTGPQIHLDLQLFSDEQLETVQRILQFFSRSCFDDHPNIQRRIEAIVRKLLK
jgi:hypothetical protein